MSWCLVRLSTGALSGGLSTGALNGGLYVSPLEMAIQSAVACSEANDGGLLVSWQLMECVLVWVVSSSLAVEDGFLFNTDKHFKEGSKSKHSTHTQAANIFPSKQTLNHHLLVRPSVHPPVHSFIHPLI